MLDKQKIETMDVHILLSIINMKIRDEFASFSELCCFYDLPASVIVQRMEQAGYALREENQQFIKT